MRASRSHGKDLASVDQIRVFHLLEATLGGTRRYLENIRDASAHLRLRMSFGFATERSDSGFQPLLTSLEERGWSTHRIEMTRAVRPVRDLRSILEVRRHLMELRPTVLHCHSSKAGAVGRLAAATVQDPPAVVYSPHAVPVHLGRRYLYVERWLSRFTDLFVAVSESERRELSDLGMAEHGSVVVVYPTVDTEYFTPASKRSARSRLELEPGAPVLLGMGRLTRQKDPLEFVRIAADLRREIEDLRIVWVGSGELQGDLLGEVERQGLKSAFRLQQWTDDVRPFLAACDVGLSTARWESFGYVVAEALAMERPIVASRVTGTVDILDGELAELTYSQGDRRGAVRLVKQILERPDRSHQLASRGRRSVQERFSSERMAERLRGAYDQALAVQRHLAR